MDRIGMNMERIRRRNRSLILNYINDNGPVSRKDIAVATGLTPASVTQIVASLMSENVLYELGRGPSTGAAGRRKVLVEINPDASWCYAVNIEPDETTVAIANIKGNAVKINKQETPIRRFPTIIDGSPEDALKKIADTCTELSADLPKNKKDRIGGVSVGITGIVDIQNGISLRAYGICREAVDIRSILEKELDLPVHVENNVDAFATAELLYGTGRKRDNLFVIKWGPGVGSTIVIDDRIYRGRNGKTAELGHTIVEKNGKPCGCGHRGCLETKVSYKNINALLPFSPAEFDEAWKNASEDVKAQIRENVDIFARTIVNTGTILAPSKIVLFGKMARSQVLRDMLIASCKAFDPAYNQERIEYTRLLDKESFIGPAAIYAYNLLFKP